MVFVYIVRCNFTAPDREASWNAWYSGPKIAQMLAQPHFVSCQRFRRTAGRGRDYVALWTMTTPEALKTPQYTSQWGFAEWENHVTDWSRDLFDGGTNPAQAFAVEPAGALNVMAFDGMSAGDAEAARAALATSQPETIWLPIGGLNRHTPWIGLNVLPDLDKGHLPDRGRVPPVEDAIYRPICDWQRAGA